MEEIYVLDSLYRRVKVIDRFESLIWTERYRVMGDFEIDLQSTLDNRNTFIVGTILTKNNSFRVMTVETVVDNVDPEGKAILKVAGRSIETILDDRVAMGGLTDLTSIPKWILTGLPADIARQIFHDVCVTGVVNTADIISGIIEGSSLYPEDTISEPSDSITVELDPTTVYEAIKTICDRYDIGFRIVRSPITGQLYFDIYTGIDRTTQQIFYPAVIFSPNLGTLQNTTELRTIVGAKNVAYVFSPVGTEIVYPLDVDPTVAGFNRHVLLVKATDITDTDPVVASVKMIQKGTEALAEARAFSGFDGEISQYTTFKYGIDYNLGDLVELRNIDGVTDQMQVTEQITICDSQGERSYPTLTVNKFITSGSWLALSFSQVWNDLDLDSTTWSEEV